MSGSSGVCHEFPRNLWMLLKQEHNRLWGALLKALLWIHSHEYFIDHTHTFHRSLPTETAAYLLHAKCGFTGERWLTVCLCRDIMSTIQPVPQHDCNTWKATVAVWRREGDSSRMACCLSAIKKGKLASESQRTETDAVQTNGLRISECPPPAFSAWALEGERRETLHAELSREQAELPR